MTNHSSPSKIFYGWWVVGALASIMFVSAGLGFYSLGVFITPFEEEFGWSRGQVSVGIALATIVSGLIGPPVGAAVQRRGAQVVLAAGATGMGISFALLGLTWTLVYLYLMFVVMAAWRACLMLVPVSQVVANWFVRRRGIAMGATTTGIGFGGLVMAPLAKILISAVGWRLTFLIMGGSIIAVGLPLALLVIRERPADRGLRPDGDEPVSLPPETQTGSGDGASPPVAVWKPGEALRTRAFVLSTMAISMGFASIGAVLLHTSPFMEDRGMAPELAGLVLGLVAGMGIGGKIVSGYLADRVAPHLVLAGVFIMEAVGLTVLISTESAAAVAAFVLVFGLSMGAVVALQPLVVAHCFGPASVATVVGLMTAFSSFFNALGPVFAGFMYDALGSYTLAYLVFIGLDCLAAGLVIFVRKPQLPAREPVVVAGSPDRVAAG